MRRWEVACHVLSSKAVFRKSLANFARLSADAVQIDSLGPAFGG